jgi:Methyltransferase FkbM domain
MVETIDDFCREHAIDRIDLLKIDVQGWELEVLRGAKTMLSRDAIWFVFAEVAFSKWHTDMQQFSELNDFMHASRFRLCGFYDAYRYGSAKQFVSHSDALYVNTDFTSAGAGSNSTFST